MTRASNARLAGAVLLVYIATGVTSLVLSGRIVAGADGTAAKLASMVQHAPLVRVNILLTLLQAAYAMVLGVTLFALTRDEDRDLAVMGLCCRVAEGVVAAISPIRALGLLSLATTAAVAPAPEAAAAQAVGAVLLKMGGWTGLIAATCFALGSALFSYLASARPKHPRAVGLAGRGRLNPARSRSSPAACRLRSGPDHELRLDPDARVRGAARGVAAHEGCRRRRAGSIGLTLVPVSASPCKSARASRPEGLPHVATQGTADLYLSARGVGESV